MASRIPAAYRFRLLLFFWLRVIGYALFITLIAVVSIVAYERGVRVSPLDGEVRASDMLRLAGGLLPIMLATVGHWLGVLLYSVFHRSETPLFLNGGWNIAGLALVAWILTIVISGVLAAAFYVTGG